MFSNIVHIRPPGCLKTIIVSNLMIHWIRWKTGLKNLVTDSMNHKIHHKIGFQGCHFLAIYLVVAGHVFKLLGEHNEVILATFQSTPTSWSFYNPKTTDQVVGDLRTVKTIKASTSIKLLALQTKQSTSGSKRNMAGFFGTGGRGWQTKRQDFAISSPVDSLGVKSKWIVYCYLWDR